MALNFSGRKILITGAGRGLGKALALAIHKAGGTVYALSKTKEHLDELVKECGRKNVIPLQVNLTDWDKTREALENLEAMDGLVNNAAVWLHMLPLLDVKKQVLDDTFCVNVTAGVNVTQVIGRKMVEAGKGGSIVNVSSINAINPMREMMATTLQW